MLLTYRKLVADNGNKKLEDAFNNQEPITGVAKNIKGGLEVIVDEARVFIPAKPYFRYILLRIYLYITVRKLHLSSLNMILRTERLSVIASSLLLQLRRAAAEAKFFLRLRKVIQSKEQLRM